jgi:NADH dehydrogenase
MAKQKILILGGGFGGIKAALGLCTNENFEVTLLSDQPDFRYYPALYRTATGGSRAQSRIALQDIFKHKPVNIAKGEATELNRSKNLVITKAGKTYHYDILIVALGVVTNYFGIKGLAEYSYGIKSLEEANKLKQHIHGQLLEKHRPDLNYIVIGGGPTGVELAGALPAYIKHVMSNHGVKHRAVHVDLVEAAPRLLPRMPKDLSRSVARRLRRLGIKLYLGKKVGGETSTSLMVEGQPIESRTVIWTAGVTNHPFLKANHFELNATGKATVDQHLRAEDNIYVIGDNADTPYSGMAQTALWDGLFISGHLSRLIAGEALRAYQPRRPVYVFPAGPRWAAVLWGKLRIYGKAGWMLRRAADLVGYHNLEPWWEAERQWIEENVSEEDCTYCATSHKPS